MRVLMANPNFLVLDEPSNDLDIDTLNVLEEFLDRFPGVLILVSHDRYLLDKLTEQLFIFPGDGDIVIYNGNYADYKIEQELLAKENKIVKEKTETTVSESSDKKTLSYKERLEYQQVEQDIKEMEHQIETLTQKLSNTQDHFELEKIAKEINKSKGILDRKTDRWLELAEYI